ncbi:MAG: efflux RND transporter periplasmic adaptor subunit [Bacteroidetes bacterium]|nr:MAG: efflux RND transporter periplasmic adaptor subunit [Bacteroidota bacterium]
MKKVFLIILLIPFLAHCSLKRNNESKNIDPQFCIPDSLMNQVKLDTVSLKPVFSEMRLIGKITFDQEKVVRIYPLVSGNVAEVRVTLGSFVKKGDVLAVIRSSEMASAENDLVTAKSNLSVAEKNYASASDMSKSGILSDKEYTTFQKELDKAQSDLKRASTVLSIYGNSSNDYVITSPISGYIVEKFVNANMQIRSDNSTNLFTISDLSKVWALADVYESDIAQIKNDEQVDVTTISYPGKKFTGKIDKIYNFLDPDSKTMKVQILLDNKDYLLKPEMFISAIVKQKSDSIMLALPASSVIFDRNQYWVIVFKEKCNIQARKLDIATSNSVDTYVRSGVNAGDKVITNRQLIIYNAMNQ